MSILRNVQVHDQSPVRQEAGLALPADWKHPQWYRLRTSDSLLTTNTPEGWEAEARRVRSVIGFEPGRLWDGVREKLDSLPASDRRRAIDSIRTGMEAYGLGPNSGWTTNAAGITSTATPDSRVRNHVRVGDAERLRERVKARTGDALGHLDRERAGTMRTVADINRRNREHHRQRS